MENGWKQVHANGWEFTGQGLPDPKAYCFSPLNVRKHRNADLQFSIQFHRGAKDYHAALCFRMYDMQHCYGVGLGGWSGEYSFFKHTDLGFEPHPFGQESAIRPETQYEFKLRFRSNRLESFALLRPKRIDILSEKVLDRALMRGGLGVYAYGGQTRATVRLIKYRDLGMRAFMLAPIDGKLKDKIHPINKILRKHRVRLKIYHSNKIETHPGLMSSIMRWIMKSDFVISWFQDGLRENVAYETGVAHALNIPTIHVTDDNCKLPSDLGSQFYIRMRDLERKLPLDVEAIRNMNTNDLHYLI